MDKKKLIIIAVVLVIAGAALGYAVVKSQKTTGTKPTSTSTITNTNKEEEEVKDATKLNLGEQITNSDIEMTFETAEFKDEIKWRTSEYSTRSASIGEGKVGLSISGKFKNLRGEDIDKSNIIGKVVVDDKYTYDLSFTPHISGYSVSPLENVEYDFYAEVPQEIKDSYSKAEFIFGHNNDFGYITTTYVNGKMTDKYNSLENLYSITVTK